MMTLLLGITTSFGQAFDIGTQVFSAGIGLGSTLGGYSRTSQTPAFSLQYEKGMWQAGESGVLSLGGYFGYKSDKYQSNSLTQTWNYSIFGIRSAYHYQGIDNEDLDLYGGLMISYNHRSYKSEGVYTGNIRASGGSTMGFSLYLGARYYFSPSIAGFAELGYGISYLNLGLAFRL